MLYDPKWKAPEAPVEFEGWQRMLLDAAEIIQRDGWIQGGLRSELGFCALGAIGAAAQQRFYRPSEYDQANRALVRHILRKIPSLSVSNAVVPLWNDNRDRTKQEVIAALQEAAKDTP